MPAPTSPTPSSHDWAMRRIAGDAQHICGTARMGLGDDAWSTPTAGCVASEGCGSSTRPCSRACRERTPISPFWPWLNVPPTSSAGGRLRPLVRDLPVDYESGMNVAVEPSTLTGTALERVPGLTEVILAGGDEAQLLRRVPQTTIDALIDAGMFRFTLPHELGGENATVQETIEVLEAISALDGSVGWNVMLGSEINAMAAGGMDPALAQKVYVENPRVVMCGRRRTGHEAEPRRAHRRRRLPGVGPDDVHQRLPQRDVVLHGRARLRRRPAPAEPRRLALRADVLPPSRPVGDPRHLGRRRAPGLGQPRRDDRGRHRGAGVSPTSAS